MQDWSDALEELERAHRRRGLTLPRGLDFSSNDYLGFSRHPALRAAAVAALEEHGMVGAGGSRLLRGHHPAHARLEEYAARFFGSGKALYFSSGFLANVALFTTLPSRHDAVIFDEAVHASVKEGIHTGAAKRYRARHNDVQSVRDELIRVRNDGAKRVFVAVESVYSMDGDLAPLKELDALAREHDAILIVDEAHATGVFGTTLHPGRGRGAAEGLDTKAWITLQACGKALGVAGALVCASANTIDYLINTARPFIYSTAPPPFLAAIVQRALEMVEEDPYGGERVLERAGFAHRIFTAQRAAPFIGSQIIPIVLGEEERALRVARALQEKGFDVRAIRPPTVKPGTSRLRISINASHSEDDIKALAAALHASIER
jgi:8-amino-7-oxononanoate synthase